MTLPQNKDNIAVCNLISINLARHVTEDKNIDWKLLEESTRLAIRQLDNLIDVNRLPIAEAIKADKENRAVGLGLMGLADTFEQLGFSYEDHEAHDLTDKVFEFISYMAIDESADLAAERGAYQNFQGSGWSQGLVPIDTLKKIEDERGFPVTTDTFSAKNDPSLDWDGLRIKIKKGIRNATVLAIAPNANIGLVAGTSPGIDPRFAQMFSRNKISGKYLEVNPNLVHDLKALELWDSVNESILSSHGDLDGIDSIPEKVKKIYKTSFSTSPYAFIEVAARAQKWVDQAISRNMYLETRDVEEIMKIYTTAWEKGLKTTYYLHMKPKHTAEQSTIRVNKAESIGKRGFAGLFTATVAPAIDSTLIEESPTPVSVSHPGIRVHAIEDPQDAMICEGCQ